jgi:ribonuclease BN (tRNA processing enzyme)
LNIRFIGTGSGKTSISRFHSSIFFSSGNYNLLVDAGDGVSKALLLQNINIHMINGILITHLHPDHFSGLSSLIVQMKLINRTNELDIYVHQSLVETVKKYLYYSYIFNEKLDFEINYKVFDVEESVSIEEGFSFITRQNKHLDKYKKYDYLKILSFSCLSVLFKIKDAVIFYTGDIGAKEDLYLFKENKINVMISEISHVELKDLLDAYKVQSIQTIYLTHISDEDEIGLEKLHSFLNDKEKRKIVIAYDGLTIDL